MIVFCWTQLPVYAARSIARFVDDSNEETVILRIKDNRFDIRNAESQTHCKVVEVSANDSRSLAEVLGGNLPDVIIAGGWGIPSFVRWTKEVRRSGGKVVFTADESYVENSFRQFLRKWRFKILKSRLFDRLFVVGKGGFKVFTRHYGVSSKRVITGLYASDPELFYNGAPLSERPKRFLFVGHFDENKNVIPMCRAFLEVREKHPDWELEICGGGPLKDRIPQENGIVLTGYVQSENLGEKYRNARALVLGSYSEKWGVVVHEACASGCALIMSSHVGSNDDFAMQQNSVIFDPESMEGLKKAFERIITMSDGELAEAQKVSVSLAQNFSPAKFSASLRAAVAELRASINNQKTRR